ncbi:NIN-like protein [Artemisia annua]|uniref:NIN-like protein n=1 Tax=Artemisia annua TaxID=35608 RepID=A0A2U1KVH7_ARTAN|nr:NIN-like protein [Artemisia annua]
MDLKRPVMPVKSANACKLPCPSLGLGSGSGLYGNHITKSMWNISFENAVPLSGDERYLYPLWVSGKEETEKKFHQSDPSHSKTTGFQLGADGVNPHNQNISDKIRNALKLLAFREIHVLVQFWSLLVIGKDQLLKTLDQPFGLGVLDEVLYSYKEDSEHYSLVVDNNQENQKYLSPPARVFLRRSPEWTFDITSYLPKEFPQQDLATRCKFHGYLALPVFDSTTGLCVGVIEVLLGSSNYKSFAYEVQQIHKALKMQTQNLTCPQAFDNHATNFITQVPNEWRDNELDKIFGILKSMCVIYDLPLAQTWAVSPSTNVVSHEKVLQKCCSSFDTKCIGKICISTADLPFHVRDLRKWKFREESVKQHLGKSEGIVGRALTSRGSYFCADVTQLNKEEFPLVHYAREDNLTSCVAIYVQSDKGDAEYVLEFFLPSGMENGRFVQEVAEALKLKFDVDSRFVLNGFLLRDWSESTVTEVSDQGSSTNLNMRKRRAATCNDDEETSSPLKKLKKDFDLGPSVPVKVTFGQSTINFRLLIPLGLLDLEKEIAQRLNLEGKRPRLKYKDEDDDLILISDLPFHVRDLSKWEFRKKSVKEHLDKSEGIVGRALASRGSYFCADVTQLNEKEFPLVHYARQDNLTSCVAIYVQSDKGDAEYVLEFFLPSGMENGRFFQVVVEELKLKFVLIGTLLRDWSDSESTVTEVSDQGSSTNVHMRKKRAATCNDDEETSSPLKKLKKDFDLGPSVPVKVTFGQSTINFRLLIPLGLLDLEKEIAQRLNLEGKRPRLKYKDEDDDLILIFSVPSCYSKRTIQKAKPDWIEGKTSTDFDS